MTMVVAVSALCLRDSNITVLVQDNTRAVWEGHLNGGRAAAEESARPAMSVPAVVITMIGIVVVVRGPEADRADQRETATF